MLSSEPGQTNTVEGRGGGGEGQSAAKCVGVIGGRGWGGRRKGFEKKMEAMREFWQCDAAGVRRRKREEKRRREEREKERGI